MDAAGASSVDVSTQEAVTEAMASWVDTSTEDAPAASMEGRP